MDNEKILAECRMEFERHQSDEWKGCTECRFDDFIADDF